MQVPVYPESRPIGIEDKDVFDAALARQPPEISELTFANLFAWRHAYDFRVSQLDSAVLVASCREPKRKYLVPVGTSDPAATMRLLMDHEQPEFIRVPEAVRDRLADDPSLRSELDRDNSDYLYRTRDLVELKGAAYDGKRNLIRQFRRTYTSEYRTLSESDISECLAFADHWCVLKDCDSIESLRLEKQAVIEMVSRCTLFRLIGAAIKVDNVFCGVAIAGQLNPSTLVMHVLKAVPDMRGLYQVLLNEFLAREAGAFEYVNLEQDLGSEGLRKSKSSYHPLRMVLKYRIWLSSGYE